MTNRISMMDLMFLLTEKQEIPCHVGAVQIFRQPRTGGSRVAGEIVAAYRRFTPRPPFNRVPVLDRTGLPEWREVDRIDPHRHVLHLRLPPPGSDEQLHGLVAELHEPLLDRGRPGWRIYVIEGLEGGRFAIYHKCHHSLVDGETGIEILRSSLSTSAQDRRIRPIAVPIRVRRRAQARAGPIGGTVEDATGLAHRVLAVGRGSLQALEGILEGLRGYSPEQPRAFTAPRTPMNDPIGAARSISHMRLPLERMKAVARASDATLNDVALAILDEAMQRYLRDLGRAPDHPLVAICPVALRSAEATQAMNQLTTIVAPLGAVSSRVVQRLRQIRENTRAAKAELGKLGQDTAYAYTVATFALTEAMAAAMPAALGSRMLLGNAVVSNVRGPAEPLYLHGARLEAIFPVSMLSVGVGLNITLMSYDDHVIFGFTANGSALPDLDKMARSAQAAFAELEARIARKTSR